MRWMQEGKSTKGHPLTRDARFDLSNCEWPENLKCSSQHFAAPNQNAQSHLHHPQHHHPPLPSCCCCFHPNLLLSQAWQEERCFLASLLWWGGVGERGCCGALLRGRGLKGGWWMMHLQSHQVSEPEEKSGDLHASWWKRHPSRSGRTVWDKHEGRRERKAHQVTNEWNRWEMSLIDF